MSIVVSNVTKSYGRQKALDDVSFTIPAGGIVGFIGPNGAGKSTMMKIITGFFAPDSGSVSVCGLPAGPDATEMRKLIGYLPENNPLYPEMYVREYLSYVAGLYRMGRRSREAVNSVIERTGLVPEQGKKIGALSKGYRQRVGLAQALIHDPQVLILDEATTGLDPNQILEIRSLISEAGHEKTVMLSTHIMQEVEAICSRVIIIDHGRIIADGPIDEISSLAGARLEETFRQLTGNR
jgi:ABC-2 type transport system ATP-binding protein